MSYLTRLGQANETGLLVPGLGLETFLDLRLDEAERRPGSRAARRAPSKARCMSRARRLSKGEARLDDGTEQGEVLFMDGQVRDADGKPVAGASSMSGTPIPRRLFVL